MHLAARSRAASGEKPRMISDNGPPLIVKDFKEFILLTGMSYVRTSPYHPQSNGKFERYHKTIKGDSIRPGQPESLEQARVLVTRFVEHYNTARLRSVIGTSRPRTSSSAAAPRSGPSEIASSK
jgi:putative transposase